MKKLREAIAEFFRLADWTPQVPLPPVGRWRTTRGEGHQTLREALRGFPRSE